MSFKMKPPSFHNSDQQPEVIKKDLADGVIAEANKDGTIYLDKSIPQNSKTGKKAIAHEKVHLDQIERGDLWYDDECVYWKKKLITKQKTHKSWEKLYMKK